MNIYKNLQNPVYKNIKIMSILLVIGKVKIEDKDERGMERMSGFHARMF